MYAAWPAGSSASAAAREELAERISFTLEMTLAPKGKDANLLTLLKRNTFSFSFPALAKGTLLIGWYEPRKGPSTAVRPKGALATAQVQFAGPGTKTVVVKLTAAGRRFVQHALAHKWAATTLEADNTFTTSTETVGVEARFALKR
jgi:hypothetical protein